MFEISELKEKKLPELQELAKTLGIPKFRSFRKLDLVYQILDFQAANPKYIKADVQELHTKKEAPSDKVKKTHREEHNKKHVRHKKISTNETASNKKQENKNNKESNPNLNTDTEKKKTQAPSHKSTKQEHKTNRGNRQQHQKDNKTHSNKEHKPQTEKQQNHREKRNRYREPDYEFDGIIESEGVLDIMQDGYGFLRSSD